MLRVAGTAEHRPAAGRAAPRRARTEFVEAVGADQPGPDLTVTTEAGRRQQEISEGAAEQPQAANGPCWQRQGEPDVGG